MPRRLAAALLILAACSTTESNPAPEPAPVSGFDLRVVRQFDVATADLAAQPGPGTVDGDYLDYGGGCGYLYKSQPREAIVIVCNGQIAAGPITELAEAQQALQWLLDP